MAFITGSNGDTRIQGGAQDSRRVNVFIDGVGQKDYVLNLDPRLSESHYSGQR